MRIIVDAMGGDFAPDEIVRGAVSAAKKYGVDIILTGDGERILRALEGMGMKELPPGIVISNASQVIGMDEDPVTAIRTKKDSSMVVGLNMLHDGAADAMVSAGSTGALLSGATLIVKRVRGIRRAALATFLPTKQGGMILIDCGANVECTAEYMLQFAFMGKYYGECVFGREDLRVALLNNGTERTKGTPLHMEAYALMEAAGKDGGLNFIGNVEAKDAMSGVCDVLVADGFSGNIMLKTMEGVGSFLMSEIKGIMTKSTGAKLAALLMRKDFLALRSRMNPDTIGGTPLLGILKPVIKAHGSSNADAISNAIRQAMTAVEARISEKLEQSIENMKVPETAE